MLACCQTNKPNEIHGPAAFRSSPLGRHPFFSGTCACFLLVAFQYAPGLGILAIAIIEETTTTGNNGGAFLSHTWVPVFRKKKVCGHDE